VNFVGTRLRFPTMFAIGKQKETDHGSEISSAIPVTMSAPSVGSLDTRRSLVHKDAKGAQGYTPVGLHANI
jgi:hypothetical protein